MTGSTRPPAPSGAVRAAGIATRIAIVFPVAYLLLTAGAVAMGDGPVPWLEVALIVASSLGAIALLWLGGGAIGRGSRRALSVGLSVALLLLALAVAALSMSRWSPLQWATLLGVPAAFCVLYARALRRPRGDSRPE